MMARLLPMCALALSVAATAAAQDTSRTGKAGSDRRVMVSKGEVALPVRVDTVYVTRYDTVVTTRVETVYRPYEVVRVDTVIMSVPTILPAIKRGPMYGAFYTGMTLPTGNVDRWYTNGFHAGAMLGWDGVNQLLGLRLNADLTQLGREQGRSVAVVGTKTALMLAVGADVKFMPFRSDRWDWYGIGGATLYSHRGLATIADNGTPDGQGGFVRAASTSARQKFGFNFGGGLDFTIAGQDLFLETRAMAIQANGARTWFIPVSLGIRYF